MPSHQSLSSLQIDGSDVDTFSTVSDIGFLRRASVSKTIYKAPGPGNTLLSESIPGPGPMKRRKTLGLNTRFDRMLAQVNVMHSYSSDLKSHRKRVRSSGSSSVSSYDLPKTPVDAYSHLREDKLGGDFSVFKMNKKASNPFKSPLVQHGPDIEVKTYGKGSQVQTPIKPLPAWLASTFGALNTKHPLRELLPSSLVDEDEIDIRARHDPHRPQGASDNSMFAFWPFDSDAHGNNDTSYEMSLHLPAANPALCDDKTHPRGLANVNEEIQTSYHGEDLGFRPFSTPGTLAVLYQTGISSASSSLAHSSEPQQIVPHVNSHFSINDGSLSRSNTACASSPTIMGPEISVSSLHRGSSIAHNINALAPNSPNFREDELPINIFSTPGPTFTVSRPVYFDSPTEHPSLSDPLEPESYQLDLNALDFRWQPFLRKTLPDHSLINPPNSSLHASATFPAFEEPYCPSLHSPGDIAYEQAAKTDPRVEYDLFRGTPVSAHVFQQTSSPQLNVQSGTGPFAPLSGDFASPLHDATSPPPTSLQNVQSGTSSFAPTSGIFISPLRNATPSPVIPDLVDVKNDQVKIQGSTPKLVSAVDSTTENREQPFTPPRPTQTSQPATPKKDRSSQTRGTQRAYRQEQGSTVSWMISRRSLAAKGAVDVEEIERLPSQRSDASHDTIESWTDYH